MLILVYVWVCMYVRMGFDKDMHTFIYVCIYTHAYACVVYLCIEMW